MPKLIIKSGLNTGKEFVLSEKPFTVGRMPDNDLELRDSLVSRKHSEIRRNGAGYCVSDLGSSNGTFLNSRKLDATKPLQDGDEVMIGDTQLIFRDESAPRPAPAPVSDAQINANLRASDEISRSIDELSEDYELDVQQSIARGVNWKEIGRKSGARQPVDGPVTAEEKTERAPAEDIAAQRYYFLYQFGKDVAKATTLDEILDGALQYSLWGVDAQRGVVMLLDPATQELVPRMARHHERGVLAPDALQVSGSIARRVITDKVAVLTNDAQEDSRFAMGMSIIQQNIRSAICVPLWEKQEVLGVLYIDSLGKAKRFTQDDLELLTMIGNQIAIRIKQEDLYHRLRTQAVMRANLERLHPPEVVDKILGAEIDTGVVHRVVSVFFADIQGFTKMSEKSSPEQISTFLNCYYETIARIVFEHHGSINKFIGDGVLAVFGGEGNRPDHALQAIRAAQQVLKARPDLNAAAPPDVTVNLRIGINSGPVMVGWVGSQKLMEYTVLGDTVNIASRLEALAQINTVCVGEMSLQLAGDAVKGRPLGKRQLRGREGEIAVFEVLEE